MSNRDGAAEYYIKNIHGDVVGVTDESGNVINDYYYDAFGNEQNVTNDNNPFRYAGEYYDEESGNLYLRNRYYDSVTGRFISEDPAQDGVNWYVYCENNPVMYTDPWGLDPFDKFSTRDEAAADFGFYIGQKSIDEEEEFFSFIFMETKEDGTVYYYYDEPRNDYETHEERRTGFRFNNFDSNAVAITHTHASYDANTGNMGDEFSSPGNSLDANYTDTSESDRFGVDYYVVTPVGNLKMYTANSGNYEGELIRSDMPVDSRITIHHYMQSTLLWGLLFTNFPNATAQDFVNAVRNNPDSLPEAINELERFR